MIVLRIEYCGDTGRDCEFSQLGKVTVLKFLEMWQSPSCLLWCSDRPISRDADTGYHKTWIKFQSLLQGDSHSCSPVTWAPQHILKNPQYEYKISNTLILQMRKPKLREVQVQRLSPLAIFTLEIPMGSTKATVVTTVLFIFASAQYSFFSWTQVLTLRPHPSKPPPCKFPSQSLHPGEPGKISCYLYLLVQFRLSVNNKMSKVIVT